LHGDNTIKANDEITLSIEAGEIHALLGENGAGKSTLLNIIFGLYAPDHGRVYVDGKEIRLHSPKDAIHLGIYMVQQNFSLIEPFTIAENISLLSGSSLTSTQLGVTSKRISDASEKFGLNVNPRDRVSNLPMNLKQRVEVLKALLSNSSLLLMDEPTSVLTPQEGEQLGQSLKSMASQGLTVLITSHKIEQVLRFCDRVTVLKSGKSIGTWTVEEVDLEYLADKMIGARQRTKKSDVRQLIEKPGEEHEKKVILEVDNIVVKSEDRIALDHVSFLIHQGEILGVAGIAGNGQRELPEAILGLHNIIDGKILIEGRDFTNHNTRTIQDQGVSYIPEDARLSAVVPEFSVTENLFLNTYDEYAKYGVLDRAMMSSQAENMIRDFDIRPPDKRLSTRYLSGGNMQKVVVAREIAKPSKLFILCNPTSGLDIGSTLLIRERIAERKRNGAAILLISEDLGEVLEMSDRIMVLFEGNIIGTLENRDIDVHRLGMMMTGKRWEEVS